MARKKKEEPLVIYVNGDKVDPTKCTKVKLCEHMTGAALGKLIAEKRREQEDARAT
jgi:hypothetical protein